MSMPIADPAKKPTRGMFRISLRALMLLILVVGGGVGWKANLAHNQRRAVAAIKAAGGGLLYDFQWPKNGKPKPKEPSGPKWLRKLIGDEYFQEVALVSFSNSVEGEALASVASLGDLKSFFVGDSSKIGNGLEHLRKLRSLEMIQLTGPGITDDRLAPLASIPGLKSILLQRTAVTDVGLQGLAEAQELEGLTIMPAKAVTDEGLVPLAKLPHLRMLQLSGASRITDHFFVNFRRKLPDLETLDLNGAAITDPGLTSLDEMPRLMGLQLQNTKVTDAGLAHLAGHGELKSLLLNGCTDVTDTSVEVIRELVNLESLSLGKTKVTDAGLARLAGLKKLRNLNVRDTQVTPQGIAALKAALPAIGITSGVTPPPKSPPKSN